MRMWSLHPKYLDAKGLVALWRETLLAQKVLRGKTKGYKNHPQLNRFKETRNPVASVGAYLWFIVLEARAREYAFDATKIVIPPKGSKKMIKVNRGQMLYEWKHLQRKLRKRDPQKLKSFGKIKMPEAHPIFKMVAGPVADWEVQ